MITPLNQLVEAQCKAHAAKYQISTHCLRVVQHSLGMSLRFSGSRDDTLRHIFEVQDLGSSVLLTVFSPSLKYSGDFSLLSEEISSINLSCNFGLWTYLDYPSPKQFCCSFTAMVQAGQPSEITSALIWDSIVEADTCYKVQAKRLLEFLHTNDNTEKTINCSYEVCSPTVLNWIVNALKHFCEEVAVSVMKAEVVLTFKLKVEGEGDLEKEYSTCLVEVKLQPNVCQISFPFCYCAQPAVFSQFPSVLYERLNIFNQQLRVGSLICEGDTVLLRVRTSLAGVSWQELPRLLQRIISGFVVSLHKFWADIATLYKPKVAGEVSEAAFTKEAWQQEMELIQRVRASPAGKYLYETGMEVNSIQHRVVYRVPASFSPLSSTFGKEVILGRDTLSALISALEGLDSCGLQFAHISQIVFLPEDPEGLPLYLIPLELSRHIGSKDTYAALIGWISAEMLGSVRELATYCSAEAAFAQVPTEVRIEVNTLRRVKESWVMGITEVRVEPVFVKGTREDVRQILQAVFMSQRPPFSSPPSFGLTLYQGALCTVSPLTNL